MVANSIDLILRCDILKYNGHETSNLMWYNHDSSAPNSTLTKWIQHLKSEFDLIMNLIFWYTSWKYFEMTFPAIFQITVKMRKLGTYQSAITGVDIKYNDNTVSLKTGEWPLRTGHFIQSHTHPFYHILNASKCKWCLWLNMYTNVTNRSQYITQHFTPDF